MGRGAGPGYAPTVLILTSSLLATLPGVRHGFATRLGGVSSGNLSTLNFGPELDGEAQLGENLRRFRLELGLDPAAELLMMRQVHGTHLVMAGDPEARDLPEADGMVATSPGVLVGVRTADCAPVLIAAIGSRGRVEAVAAVHAGWRGATAGIVPLALARLGSLGARIERSVVAVGPTIGPASFEVGEEVIDAARRSLGGREPPMSRAEGAKPHLDLVALIEEQILEAGVDPRNVERVGGCTFENRAMYFSHRRDHGVTGRHLSAIGFGYSPGEIP